MWKWINGIAISLLVLVIGVRVADRLARRTQPLPTVPQANGYDRLLEAANKATPLPHDLADLSAADVRDLFQQNQPALQKVREGLAMDCRVPLQTKTGWSDEHAENLSKLKRLGVLLALESRVLLLDGRTNETWRSSLDMIRLGQALSRGGLLIDGIAGMTLETVGTATLQAMVPQLSAGDCRKAVQSLEELEARRSSAEQISQNEKIWSAKSYGLVDRVGARTMRQSLAKRHAEFKQRYEEICRRTRRLELRLAVHLCELETGKRPGTAAELVPTFLKALPFDPTNGKPIAEIPPVPAFSGESRQAGATPAPISAP